MNDGLVLVRVVRRWVPVWLYSLACHWTALALLLTVHDTDVCECSCHDQPGMRECDFCGWQRG